MWDSNRKRLLRLFNRNLFSRKTTAINMSKKPNRFTKVWMAHSKPNGKPPQDSALSSTSKMASTTFMVKSIRYIMMTAQSTSIGAIGLTVIQ